MNEGHEILRPNDESLAELTLALRRCSGQQGDQLESAWPAAQMQVCAERGVFRWFVSSKNGGLEWSDADLVRGYIALGMGCLTTAFILTQRVGASQRIERSENHWVRETILPDLTVGKTFATLGISHLTTSRRHLREPVLRATETAAGYELSGYSPWVTGADHADFMIIGATLPDERQILAAVPAQLPGVRVAEPEKLVGLSGSRTGRVDFEGVSLPREWLLAGPVNEVMKQGIGARTGGLQTSALALGLSRSAIEFLEGESSSRADLSPPATALRSEWDGLYQTLLDSAANVRACDDAELRRQANSLVLRSTQAALTAAKGAGYLSTHVAGRWCREALFFLVWSCPQPVLAGNLCEFAGLEY